MMNTEYCLCHEDRVIYGPAAYSRDGFGRVLAHHGGSSVDLPEFAPAKVIDVLYLRLMPVVDIAAMPERSEFYHIGQPVLTVQSEHVERNCPVALYPVEYCAGLVESAISQSADQALGMLERGYTERVVKTWPQQQAEAAAYIADNTAEVTLLSGIAERRGITLSDLVQRVLDNVQAAAGLTGIVLGDEQAATDKIKALKVLSDNGQLPDDWFEQLQSISESWRKDWPPELLDAANS